ncbi:DUF917 family protein [Arthrobacter sp. 24S4-2]|uniref:S-methyl thiohydantoin desulfurase domain-containing protein n=1 Tax=Arthrobacter sp. 24S4-2 TaxID=2575374 RepID=UPI001586B128|nr:DUF917 family protein [Arthrobacter sp. 24S4-2]
MTGEHPCQRRLGGRRGRAPRRQTECGPAEDRGRTVTVRLQNENLLAEENGRTLAGVPDLITVFDSATGHPIATESIRFGQRVTVLAWPCDPIWRTERGLAIAGPAAFGFDHPYVPLEALNA